MTTRSTALLAGLLMLLARPGFGSGSEPELERICQNHLSRARELASRRTPNGYLESIKEYQLVLDTDVLRHSDASSDATLEMKAVKRTLRAIAQPLASKAATLERSNDLLGARRLLLQATSIDPFTSGLQSQLEAVQQKCHHLSKEDLIAARARLAIDDFVGARALLDSAGRFDSPGRENRGDFGPPDESHGEQP